MRTETMRIVGRSLLLLGVALAVIGTLTLYASLSAFSSCELAPANSCIVDSALYVKFINTQAFGNSLSFYGMVSLILGAVLYISAWTRIPAIGPVGESVRVPQQAARN